MKINFEKFVKATNTIDSELLNKIEYNDILFSLAKTLLDYRKYYNFVQKTIADKLECSQEMISKIESGKYNVSIKSIVDMWSKLSTKDYNFAEKLLNNMLEKANENYDIRFNYDTYKTSDIIMNDTKPFLNVFELPKYEKQQYKQESKNHNNDEQYYDFKIYA